MRRGLVLVLLLMGGAVLYALQAQDQQSLTKDFPKLSAKERSRIAAREQEEAAQDRMYQEVMERAEAALRSGALADALKGFEEARTLRPYNVYPKVKIEDLRTRIRAQAPVDTAAPGVEVPVEDAPVPAAGTPVPGTPAEVQQAPVVHQAPPISAPTAQPQRSEAALVVPTASSTKPGPVRTGTSSAPLPVADHAPPSPGERRYREGRAFVIERTIEGADGMEVHKCVTHPSGQVFYFKDGRSVDSREWRTIFGQPDPPGQR